MSDQPAPEAVGAPTGDLVAGEPLHFFRQPCPAPAPLVVNGSPFVGCQREAGHKGQHEVRIAWGDR